MKFEDSVLVVGVFLQRSDLGLEVFRRLDRVIAELLEVTFLVLGRNRPASSSIRATRERGIGMSGMLHVECTGHSDVVRDVGGQIGIFRVGQSGAEGLQGGGSVGKGISLVVVFCGDDWCSS